MILNAKKIIVTSVLPLLVLLFTGCGLHAGKQQPAGQDDAKRTVEDVIPLTVGNLRGHKMLYNEGWFIVTSSSKALEYAKSKSIISSKHAVKLAGERSSGRAGGYKEGVKESLKASHQTGKDLVTGGTRLTGDILGATHKTAKAELAYAGDRFKKAVSVFVKGNISIVERTEADRQELMDLPGNYFTNLKSDFSNIWEMTTAANDSFAGKIEVSWDSAFERASREFQAEYDKSGDAPNSLMALGPILYGYLKSFYHGLAAPASKTIVKTGAVGTTAAAQAVFLPVAGVSVVAGRTVQSVGLTFYYVGKTGVKIVSPTVESGLLSGLSLLSLSAVPVTYGAGGTLGAMNQVAFTAAGPALGTLEATGMTAGHTAAYVGFVTYDGVKGATRVVINQARSGVVLGYNALTAIPTHALLGVSDAAVFLAWDGPRLAIVAAQGKLKTTDASGDKGGASLGVLPVGTVVDLKKLEDMENMKVDVISTDTTVIQEVLEKIPCDLREQNESCEKP